MEGAHPSASVLVDEISEGSNPAITRLTEVLAEERRARLTIVLEQNVGFALALADRQPPVLGRSSRLARQRCRRAGGTERHLVI
jgi:ABC-type branched-subunit amino acid transport system ATPase component